MSEISLGTARVDLEVNANGVAEGVARAGRAIDTLGTNAAQAGAQASAAVEGIGAAGQESARQFDKSSESYKRNLRQIENEAIRTAATMKAVAEGSGQAGALLNKAIARGVDPADIEKSIAALREWEKTASKGGITARELAFATRTLPAQFTDIAVSLQAGQAPLTVLLQQGGQLKDMFGGVGNAAKAMGGYVAGLINPFTLTAATLAAVGYAAFKADQEIEGMRNALLTSGNAVGTTTDQMRELAAQTGISADSLIEMVKNGKLVGVSLEEATREAQRFERLTGTAVAETAKKFAELAKSPAEAAISINGMTSELYRQIKVLEETGQKTEAARLAQDAFNREMKRAGDEAEVHLGPVSSAWNRIKDSIEGAWDATKKFLGGNTLAEEVAAQRAKVAKAQAAADSESALGDGQQYYAKQLEAEKQRLFILESSLSLEKGTVEAKKKATEQANAGIALQQQAEKYLDKEEKQRREILAVENLFAQSAKTAVDIEARRVALLGIAEKFKDKKKDAPYSPSEIEAAKQYASVFEKLVKLEAEATAKTQELNAAEKIRAELMASGDFQRMPAQMQKIIDAKITETSVTLDLAEAQKQAKKAADDAAQGALANLNSTAAYNQSLEDHIAKIDADTAAVYGNITATREQAIELELVRAGVERGSEAWQLYAEKMRTAMDANAAAKQNRSMWNSIEQAAHDTWTAVARDGKDAFETIGKTIKSAILDLLYQITVKKWIIGISASLNGQGAAGSIAGAIQGGSSVSSGLSTLNSLSTAYSALTGGITSSIAGAIGSAGTLFGSSALTSFAAGMKGASLAAGMAGPTTAGATGAMGAGSSFAAAIPVVGWIMAGMAASGALYGKGFSDKSGGGGIGDIALAPQRLSGSILRAVGISDKWANIITGAPITAALFGRAAPKTTDSGISGTFSGEGFTGESWEKWLAKGGLFRSDKRGTNRNPLTGELDTLLDTSFSALKFQISDFAKALGLPTEQIANYSKTIDISFKNAKTDADRQKIITDMFAGMADDMARAATATAEKTQVFVADAFDDIDLGDGFLADLGERIARGYIGGMARVGNALVAAVNPLDQYAKEGEKSAETLARLATSLTSVNGLFDQLHQTLLPISLSGGDAASKLIDLAGGFDALTGKLSNYYDLFYTEEEKRTNLIDNLKDAFGALNLTLPDTREAFRAIVEAQDLTTEAGRATYNALLDLAPAFASVTDAVKTTVDGVTEAVRQARQEWQEKLDVLTGKTTDRELQLQRDLASTTDETTRALIRQVYAQEDLQAAASTAMEAMQQTANELRQVGSFRQTIAGSIHDIEAQMPGYSASAYYGGQITDARAQITAATTTEGRIAGGEKLRDAIMGRYNAELQAIQTNQAAAETAARASFDASESASRAAIGAANQLNAAYRKIGDYAKSLLTSANSPLVGAARLAAARSDYASLLAQSRTGDLTALGKLTGAADTYLGAAKDQSATALDYARVFGTVLGDTTALGNKAGADLEFVQRQFYFDASAYQQQALSLQTDTIKDLGDLNKLTEQWQADLQTSLDEQALAYVGMGLSLEQIKTNTDALGPGFTEVSTAISAALLATTSGDAVIAELRALRGEVAQLRADNSAENLAIAGSTSATARTLDRAMPDGDALAVRTAP